MDACPQKELLAICRDHYMLQMQAEALGISQKKKQQQKTPAFRGLFLASLKSKHQHPQRREKCTEAEPKQYQIWCFSQRHQRGPGALIPRQATLTTGPSWVIAVDLC